MVDVAVVLAGIAEHLGDDLPLAGGLFLQDVQGVVVAQGDGAAANQALAGDLEVGGDDDDVVSDAAQGAGGRGGELAVVEVLVGEQAAQVGDDLGTALFDAAERVHPVRVAGVNAGEQAGVTLLKPASKVPMVAVMPAWSCRGPRRVLRCGAGLRCCRAGVVKTWLSLLSWGDVHGEVRCWVSWPVDRRTAPRVLPEWQS